MLKRCLSVVVMLAVFLAMLAPSPARGAASPVPPGWTLRYTVKVGTEIYQVVRYPDQSQLVLKDGKLPAPDAPWRAITMAIEAREVYTAPESDLEATRISLDAFKQLRRAEIVINNTAAGAAIFTLGAAAPGFLLPALKGLAFDNLKDLATSPRHLTAYVGHYMMAQAVADFEQAVVLSPKVRQDPVDADAAARYVELYVRAWGLGETGRHLLAAVEAKDGWDLVERAASATISSLTGRLKSASEIKDAVELLAMAQDFADILSELDRLEYVGAANAELAHWRQFWANLRDGVTEPAAVQRTRALLAGRPMTGAVATDDAPAVSIAMPPDTLGTMYGPAAALLSKVGILSGGAGTPLRPSDPVTRAEMAAFALRTLKVTPAPVAAAPFLDVAKDHWSAPFVAEAARRGLLTGYQEGTFRAAANLTEMEALTVLIRLAGAEEAALELGPWPDGYKAQAVQMGLLTEFEKGLMVGSRSFSAGSTADRGMVALLLHRLLLLKSGGVTLAESRFGLTPAQVRAYAQMPADTWVDVADALPESLHKKMDGNLMVLMNGRLLAASGRQLYAVDPALGSSQPLSTLPEEALALLETGDGLLLYGAKNGFYFSPDGTGWSPRANWPEGGIARAEASGRAIVHVAKGFLFSDTLYLSLDGGLTWAKAKEAFPEFTDYDRVWAAGGAIYGEGRQGGKPVLLRRRPGSAAAETLPLGDGLKRIDAVAVGLGGELYVAAHFETGGLLLVSADDGQSWTRMLTDGLRWESVKRLVPQEHSLLAYAYYLYDDNLYRLPYGGTVWQKLGEVDSLRTEPGGQLALSVKRGGGFGSEAAAYLLREPFTTFPPVLTSAPYTALRSGEGGTVTLTGRGFAPGARFWIGAHLPLDWKELSDSANWVMEQLSSHLPGPAALVGGTVKSGGQAEVRIPAGMQEGLYWLGIQNPDGQTAWIPGAVSIGWKGTPTAQFKGILADENGKAMLIDPSLGVAYPMPGAEGLSGAAAKLGVRVTSGDYEIQTYLPGTGHRQRLLTYDWLDVQFDRPGSSIATTGEGEWVFALSTLLHHGAPVLGAAGDAAFSPAGDRLAVAGEAGLMVWRLPDLKKQVLETAAAQRPVWSPDGKYIAYLLPKGMSSQVAVRTADGRGPRVLLGEPGAKIENLFWSPTGRLYVHTVVGPWYDDSVEVFSVLPDGSDKRNEWLLANALEGMQVIEWR